MWESILAELNNFIGVLVAAALGFAIGFERKLRRKEAGIGTHTVVCIGAALIMVVSKFGFAADTADASRVAAQIVSGIGFIGAGIIAYRQQKIHGLTTAAGVWATAGVGMASGAGLYITALCTTMLIIVLQCIFHSPVALFRSKRYYRLHVVFEQHTDEADRVKKLFCTDRFYSLDMRQNNDQIRCSVAISTATEFTSARLTQIMAENKFILSVVREDDD